MKTFLRVQDARAIPARSLREFLRTLPAILRTSKATPIVTPKRRAA
jgi:hypothetical protein